MNCAFPKSDKKNFASVPVLAEFSRQSRNIEDKANNVAQVSKCRNRMNEVAVRTLAADAFRLIMRLDTIAKKLKMPFVLHRSGKGKLGRGACWVVRSLYPVDGIPYPGMVQGCGGGLLEALDVFYRKLPKLKKRNRKH